MTIYDEEKMKQLSVYPTKQTPSYADWRLFEMGKELEQSVGGGIPVPEISDAGKVIKVDSEGEYSLEDDESLPAFTTSDEGKVLEVTVDSSGETPVASAEWTTLPTIPSGDDLVPAFTTSDDGKVLEVVVNSTGDVPVASAEWTTPPVIPSGDDLVPAFTTSDEGKVLEVVVDSTGDTPVASAEWTAKPSYTTETWTFTLADSSTVTKTVYIVPPSP